MAPSQSPTGPKAQFSSTAAGTKEGRPIAALNMFPMSSTAVYFGWTGDGAAIMANALLYGASGAATGDPHLIGPNGTSIDFDGVPGAAYVLFASPALQINVRLVETGPSFKTGVAILVRNESIAFDLTPMTPAFRDAVDATLVRAGAGSVTGWQPWRIAMTVCGHAVVVSQMHGEAGTQDGNSTASLFTNYYDVAVTPPRCDDAYGGALGVAWRCGADGKAAGWRTPVQEDGFRVASVTARAASFEGGSAC